MSIREFFEAAEQLDKSAKELRQALRACLPQAEDVLCGTQKLPEGATLSKESVAHQHLVQIRGPLEQLLAAYDEACLALGKPWRFFIYSNYWKASSDVQRQVRWTLAKKDQ